MKRYFIDFKNDPYGIDLVCKNEDEARKIVENPRNWKDGKTRIIDRIWEEKE